MATNSNKQHIVIIGGGYSGVLTAVRLAGKVHNTTVTLVNGSGHFVERIRLHQLAADQALKRHAFEDLLAGTAVRFVQGWITQIQPEAQSIHVRTAAGPQHIAYDYLVYALGSFIDTSPVPGAGRFAHSLSTEATTHTLRKQLPEVAARAGRLIVAGGGLTGIEAAAELAEAYPTLQVSLVTRDAFGAQFSERGQAHVRRVFDKLGIDVLDGRTITEITERAVVTADGSAVTFDVCLWAGAFGVPTLAREAGLRINQTGQISVDPHLRSVSHPHILAVGDAASLETAVETPIRMACATAMPMGAYAADYLAAVVDGKERPQPFSFAYSVQCVSLGRNNGLVQMVDAHDNPKNKVLTGRPAKYVKELICRSTLWALRLEKRFPGLYRWLKPKGTDSAVPQPHTAR